jgi:energy-coupling factor transporter ATP-binding protein EcfA2
MAGVNDERPVIVSFEALADEILVVDSPRLVAVDGRAGSGKTTFATRLGRLLPAAVVIEIDDFLNWSDLDDWWPRLEKEAIAPLLAGPHTSSPATLPLPTTRRRKSSCSARRIELAEWADAPRRADEHQADVSQGQR